ncbi:capsular biosynthesis protein [Listeria ivanovii]|uniref:YveK family protein n=1 Tax=Listeria ivanovii TaxID=1638 RepID=UPI000DAAC805|nr:Wzz/FepE/Etk N-terminal domain-containing protein [Listeria ivanovii]PZG37779.1 capsular biosynthesis protein [Listeria ivanovii]
MEKTLDIKYIGQFFKKYWYIIVAACVVGMIAIAFYTSYFVTPIYQVSTDVLVNQKKNEQVTVSDVQSNQQFVNTYSVILTSSRILDQVKDNLNLPQSVKQLKQQITIENVANSQVITIKVTDSSAEKATLIANKVTTVFKDNIKNIMDQQNVSILSEAKADDNNIPIKPNKKSALVMGAFGGLVIGILFSFSLQLLNTTIKSEKDIEALTDIPILGSIQKERKKKRRRHAKRTFKTTH